MIWPKPRDAMRAFLALCLLAAFMVALFMLFKIAVPDANRDLVTYMLGQLSGFAGAAFLFYFGTTKSSADKNEMLRDATFSDVAGPTPAPDSPRCDCQHDDTARGYPDPEFGFKELKHD